MSGIPSYENAPIVQLHQWDAKIKVLFDEEKCIAFLVDEITSMDYDELSENDKLNACMILGRNGIDGLKEGQCLVRFHCSTYNPEYLVVESSLLVPAREFVSPLSAEKKKQIISLLPDESYRRSWIDFVHSLEADCSIDRIVSICGKRLTDHGIQYKVEQLHQYAWIDESVLDSLKYLNRTKIAFESMFTSQCGDDADVRLPVGVKRSIGLRDGSGDIGLKAARQDQADDFFDLQLPVVKVNVDIDIYSPPILDQVSQNTIGMSQTTVIEGCASFNADSDVGSDIEMSDTSVLSNRDAPDSVTAAVGADTVPEYKEGTALLKEIPKPNATCTEQINTYSATLNALTVSADSKKTLTGSQKRTLVIFNSKPTNISSAHACTLITKDAMQLTQLYLDNIDLTADDAAEYIHSGSQVVNIITSPRTVPPSLVMDQLFECASTSSNMDICLSTLTTMRAVMDAHPLHECSRAWMPLPSDMSLCKKWENVVSLINVAVSNIEDETSTDDVPICKSTTDDKVCGECGSRITNTTLAAQCIVPALPKNDELSGCRLWYHLDCAGLTEHQFNSLMAAPELRQWCCARCRGRSAAGDKMRLEKQNLIIELKMRRECAMYGLRFFIDALEMQVSVEYAAASLFRYMACCGLQCRRMLSSITEGLREAFFFKRDAVAVDLWRLMTILIEAAGNEIIAWYSCARELLVTTYHELSTDKHAQNTLISITKPPALKAMLIQSILLSNIFDVSGAIDVIAKQLTKGNQEQRYKDAKEILSGKLSLDRIFRCFFLIKPFTTNKLKEDKSKEVPQSYIFSLVLHMLLAFIGTPSDRDNFVTRNAIDEYVDIISSTFPKSSQKLPKEISTMLNIVRYSLTKLLAADFIEVQ